MYSLQELFFFTAAGFVFCELTRGDLAVSVSLEMTIVDQMIQNKDSVLLRRGFGVISTPDPN